MARTQFVEYSETGFWAYDVALGIFLKHLIDAAESSPHSDEPWLSSAVSDWRVAACISDYGLVFNPNWSANQRHIFLALAEEACARLDARESIPAEEILSWTVLKDENLSTRGESVVRTAPVTELGRAIIALLKEELPSAPKGEVWFYGTPNGRTTLRKPDP